MPKKKTPQAATRRKRADRAIPGADDSAPLRFPAPEAEPRFDFPPRDEQDRARMQNELHDWEMRSLIHAAVHTNDPEARRILASRLSWNLHTGLPLMPASREWLSWALMRLSDTDQLPHLARGNAIKADARVALIQRLVQVMQQLPPGPVTKRLEKAGKTLAVSFGTVRTLYYSDSYRLWSLVLSAARANSKQFPPK